MSPPSQREHRYICLTYWPIEHESSTLFGSPSRGILQLEGSVCEAEGTDSTKTAGPSGHFSLTSLQSRADFLEIYLDVDCELCSGRRGLDGRKGCSDLCNVLGVWRALEGTSCLSKKVKLKTSTSWWSSALVGAADAAEMKGGLVYFCLHYQCSM